MPAAKKLSILIPVYNERHTIRRVVEAAANAPLPPGVDRELIVIDDGSVDGTEAVLHTIPRGISYHLFRSERNQGKGSAIRAGIPHAKGDFILIQDGDLEYDVSAYEAIVRPLLESKARVVYGSRFLGTIESMAWPYRVVNRLLVAWTNFLYGTSLTDEATAYKAFDAELLRGLKLKARRFEFCPEVTGKISRLGIPIHEVPVKYLGRTREQGKKIRWYDAITAFWVLLRERVIPRNRG